MEQEFYTDEELVLLRAQFHHANAEAKRMWERNGVTLDPRIREALGKLKK